MTESLVSDYKHDDSLRAGLEALAKDTFCLDLEPWYQAGFWDDRYIPYSIVCDGTVAANVSVNLVTLTVDGRAFNTVMLGTVMTALPYRGRGYAARLIRTVLEKYRGGADFFYLFANDTVLDFYPKFGFKQWEEKQCFASLRGIEPRDGGSVRPLDATKPDDLAILLRLIETGHAAPKRLMVTSNRSLLLFYCLGPYRGSVYYYPREDLLLFFHDGVLLDYYAAAPLPLEQVLALFAAGRNELPLGFSPLPNVKLPLVFRHYDDHLFATEGAAFFGGLMFPSLSRA